MPKRLSSICSINTAIRRRIACNRNLEGLVIQPSGLSQQEISSIMREGRRRMIETLGEDAIHQAISNIKSLVGQDRVDLDEAARKTANGHYVNQTKPGVDSLDVSNHLHQRKDKS